MPAPTNPSTIGIRKPGIGKPPTVSIPVTLQGDDAQPLGGYRVKVTLLDENDQPTGTLETRTGADGTVNLGLPLIPKEGADPIVPKVRVEVVGLDGDNPIFGKDYTFEPDQDKKPFIENEQVPVENYRTQLAVPIKDWAKEVNQPLDRIEGILSNAKITTLADVRDRTKYDAALQRVDQLSASERAAAKQQIENMRAHAELQVLSRNNKQNQILVENQYRSLPDIAQKSRFAFLKSIGNKIKKEEAVQLHSTARKQLAVLNNIAVEQRIYEANGYQTRPQPFPGAGQLFTISSTPGGSQNGNADQPTISCCEDCLSALSPAAYLSDLLSYAAEHITYKGNELTLSSLVNYFHQPFDKLPASCAAVETPVRQTRICIEVLHKLAPSSVRSAVDACLSAHAKLAYEAILRELGISVQQLRLVRQATPEQRKALADRLGIRSVGSYPNDNLSKLLLLPDRAGVQGLNEIGIEAVFGLPGTQRDPLSTGAFIQDGQILRWQLTGVEWRRTTFTDGRIYGRLRKESNNKYTCELFKSLGRIPEDLVASGFASSGKGEMSLQPVPGSKLTGKIQINYKSDLDFEIVAIPLLLVQKLQFLRSQWQNAVTQPQIEPWKGLKIDPDLLAESDFIRPYITNKAYEIWKKRKDWLENLDGELKKSTTLNDLLQSMTQPIPYNDYSFILFSTGAQPNWSELLQEIQSPDAEGQAKAIQYIADNFSLTPETRVMT